MHSGFARALTKRAVVQAGLFYRFKLRPTLYKRFIMISVIIPAMNEENTIGQVVKASLEEALVTEVIVVDDRSEDGTIEAASKAGAKVIISNTRGKGISMKDGLLEALNEIVVFLDGDIDPYPERTVRKLVTPILNNEAEFVKGAFARNAGRVTELVAKPLLNILFPGLAQFSQPLSRQLILLKNLLKPTKKKHLPEYIN